jgi:hypothetical protein
MNDILSLSTEYVGMRYGSLDLMNIAGGKIPSVVNRLLSKRIIPSTLEAMAASP